MKYEWDKDKQQQTLEKHNVDFADAEKINWGLGLTREDTRKDYGETRFVTIAPIEGRLHVLAW